ncbi:mechanosensitive ion channel family protein [Tenacibaculum jejuense]|uniref:Mechanosensitive ion channel family protein n=1 Tax=Tenacibaculum jejuense TaxID=584609 RepID=A0A238UCD2_9FLAO|nr:mechanosensitive ion channel family protein [Tenacibaculum jejuense]SNR16752.1 Mechanosensitive ion channel family protein [Tenacibaculum jejuense]
MKTIDFDEILKLIQEKAIVYVPKLLLGGLILWIGMKLANRLINFLSKILEKAGFDDTIRPFLVSMLSFILKGALLLIVASILGVNLSSLVALLAAIGFAIGMALQGSLGNFASGILILTLKPYKSGDWIQVEEKFGKVEEIGIFSTTIVSPGHKTLIIPNAKITDGVVTNYSKKGMVRLEINVTMPYAESFPKVKEIIKTALANVNNILTEPETEIGIETFDSHSIELTIRPYVHPEDFWQVTFDTHETVKKAFSDHKIQVAYSEGVELGSIGE